MANYLFRFTRTWLGSLLVGWLFAYFNFAIPVKRILETDALLAFHHPQPSYPLHILLVPKRKYKAIIDIPTEDIEFMQDLFKAVKELVNIYKLEKSGYRLITNGGSAQDVPHLHFHLIGVE